MTLLESTRRLGGRVAAEARLPGLAEWIRVRDYRTGQIERMPNVTYYLESELDADDVLEYGFAHVAVATGARWRTDGVGRWHTRPLPLDDGLVVFGPDDLLAGTRPDGRRVVVFDDDHYYMGGVLAELLAREGFAVTLVTPDARVSAWTTNTMEQHRIQARLLDLGVEARTDRVALRTTPDAVVIGSVYTGGEEEVPCDAVVLVTARLPRDDLAVDLGRRRAEWRDSGLLTMRAVGDALAPGTIASAVWDGRRFAEELQTPGETALFRRDVPALG